MQVEGEIQVGVFYYRIPLPAATAYRSIPIEMGGGEGNLVRLWAIHYNLELIKAIVPATYFIGIALSSNPEHENNPIDDFAIWQSDKALYGRHLWIADNTGTGNFAFWRKEAIIPLYGLVRPRRQIMSILMFQYSAELLCGVGAEVYYQPTGAVADEREIVNRKYGKYKRS